MEVSTGAQASEPGTAALTAETLRRQILHYLPGTVGPAVGLLAFAAVFTRVFDTAGYGRYSLVFSVATLLAALFGQWLVQSINRFVAASGDLARDAELIGAALSLITFAVVAAAVLVGPLLAAELDPAWRPFIVTGALVTLSWGLFQPLLSTSQATLRAASNSLLRLAQVGLRLGLATLLVFTIWPHPAALLAASAVGSGLLAGLLWWRSGIPFLFNPLARRIRPGLARWSRYGVPMIPWYACSVLLAVGDRYVIQWLRGPSEVGIYAANYGIVAGGAGLLAAPIRLAAHPFLMRAWGQGNRERTVAWLSRIISILIFAMIVVVGVTILLAPDLARIILGPQFREGWRVMPIALAGIALWQLGIYTHKPFEFHERTGAMMGLAAAAAAVNLALNLVSVGRFGYMAAAWTTTASYALYVCLTGWLGRRIFAWRLEWRRLLPPTAGFTTSLVALAAVRHILARRVSYPVELAVFIALLSLVLAGAAVLTLRMLRADLDA